MAGRARLAQGVCLAAKNDAPGMGGSRAGLSVIPGDRNRKRRRVRVHNNHVSSACGKSANLSSAPQLAITNPKPHQAPYLGRGVEMRPEVSGRSRRYLFLWIEVVEDRLRLVNVCDPNCVQEQLDVL